MTLPIETERLILRRYAAADVPQFIEFLCHPSVARIVVGVEATAMGVEKYIEAQNALQPFEQDKHFDLVIERRRDGRLLGVVGMIRQAHKQGEIGWALGVAFRGQGYATEAARALMAYGFTTLGLHRISADTTGPNVASWRLMERLGMRREAHLREAEFRDGEWIDYYIYAILVYEWMDS